MLDVEFAQLSNAGRVRDHNEDYLGCVLPDSPARASDHGWLFALADGVGGHDLGEVASRAAVESVLAGFRKAAGQQPLQPLLTRLIQDANTQVLETGMSSGSAGLRMATTIVALILRYDRTVVAHVGDSRCYLVRHGHARQLTRDHTVTNELVRLGTLSAGEASGTDASHILTRSLGGELVVGVETSEHPLQTGDVLVLCSDGLHGSVGAAEIGRVVSHAEDLNAAAEKLVNLANERDGSDNISVQLIRVRGVERVGMYRGRPYRLG
jgi:PPM family protein phosphatase